MPAIRVTRITVLADRVRFDILLDPSAPRRTDASMAARALQVRPRLASHTCVNSTGSTFGDVMQATPVPHLVEHVAIDVLADKLREAQLPRTVVTGTSEWTDRQEGRACVELSCPDDLLVLHAFNEAVHIVGELMVG